MGEVQVVARDGHKVPMGTGLNKNGEKTDNPSEIANGGVLLTFGDYKGVCDCYDDRAISCRFSW